MLALLALAAAGIASHAYARIGVLERGVGGTQTAAATARRDTYVLVTRDGDVRGWGPEDDAEAIAAARRAIDGEFFWVHRGGRAYVITDAALFARAQDAWRDADALQQEVETLQLDYEARERRMETLVRRIDKRAPQASSAAAELAREFEQAQSSLRGLARRIEDRSRAFEQASEAAAHDLHALASEAFAADQARPAPISVALQQPRNWTTTSHDR